MGVRPEATAIVEVQAIGIGVARVVEPVARSLFAEIRLGEQPVNKMLICVRGRVGYEFLNFFRCWQYPGEVEGHPANKRSLVGLRSRLQTFFLEPCKNEIVDRVLCPIAALSIKRNDRANRDLERPVRTVNRALPDPLLEGGDLSVANRLGFPFRPLPP